MNYLNRTTSSTDYLEVLRDKLQATIANLLEEKNTLSEYELIKILSAPPFHFFTPEILKDSLKLFQVHFIVFHCLYRLKIDYAKQQAYLLDITPLKITLKPTKYITSDSPLAHHDPLATYYLDLKQIYETSKSDVEQMLVDFWQRYHQKDDLQKALITLGFNTESTQNLSFECVKKAYKKQTLIYHPDRGGSNEKIIEINTAYSIAKKLMQ